MMSFLFLKLFLREAILLKEKQLCAKGNNYVAPGCDTSDSNLLVVRDQYWWESQHRQTHKYARVIQVRVYGCQIHHVFSVPISVHLGSLAFFSYILTKIHKMTNSYDRMKLYYPFYQEKRILIWLYHGRWPDLSTTNLTLKVWNLIQDTIFKHRTLSVLYYVATYSAKRANLSKSL